MTQLSTLNKYFWKYRWLFSLGFLFVVLTNYFKILAPQLTGYVVNIVVQSVSGGTSSYIPTENYDRLIRYLVDQFSSLPFVKQVLFAGIVLIGTAVISGFFMFLMRQTIIVMSRHIEYDQKNEIFSHYQLLDSTFYKMHSTGDLMNRISEDVSRVRSYIGPAVMYFINLAATIGFSLYFMFRSDLRLTLIALCPLPILAFTIYMVNTIINRKSERIQALLSSLTTNAQESFSGIRVIKSFVQERTMSSFFGRNSELYRDNALSLAKTEAIYFPSMGLLIGLSTLITVLVGGLDVIHGVPGSSIGKIAEFVMYIQMLTFPVSAIGWTASMTQRAVASQRRINEFLLTRPKIQSAPGSKKIQIKGHISFEHADFTYSHTGIHAINDFTLEIKQGEKVAIVGRTGSGKSTVVQLLLRMFDLQSGSLKIDGVPIDDIDLKELRSQISYIPQDIFLFSDTIRNNILFGNKDASEDDLVKAAKQAVIYDEIMRFPDGFDTMVGERGVMLSGGQKQRISIARGLIKNPAMIIFDDCLSAVDGKTEKAITSNLSDYLTDKTAIIVTHRIFSLLTFDKIVVMDQGRIAEYGTHDDLIKKRGLYYQMYRRQQMRDSATSYDE